MDKKQWTEPTLTSLDIEETLGGILANRSESFVTDNLNNVQFTSDQNGES